MLTRGRIECTISVTPLSDLNSHSICLVALEKGRELSACSRHQLSDVNVVHHLNL